MTSSHHLESFSSTLLARDEIDWLQYLIVLINFTWEPSCILYICHHLCLYVCTLYVSSTNIQLFCMPNTKPYAFYNKEKIKTEQIMCKRWYQFLSFPQFFVAKLMCIDSQLFHTSRENDELHSYQKEDLLSS